MSVLVFLSSKVMRTCRYIPVCRRNNFSVLRVTPYLFNIHFNIILPCLSRLSSNEVNSACCIHLLLEVRALSTIHIFFIVYFATVSQ
jgi:hypothetical protein